MSDPGTSYRTREEVEKARAQRDPLELMRARLIEAGFATDAEIKDIERAIREDVAKALEEAKAGKFPAPEELYSDILTTGKPAPKVDDRFRMESEPVVARMPDRTQSKTL